MSKYIECGTHRSPGSSNLGKFCEKVSGEDFLPRARKWVQESIFKNQERQVDTELIWINLHSIISATTSKLDCERETPVLSKAGSGTLGQRLHNDRQGWGPPQLYVFGANSMGDKFVCSRVMAWPPGSASARAHFRGFHPAILHGWYSSIQF